jgi:hypothetical protein
MNVLRVSLLISLLAFAAICQQNSPEQRQITPLPVQLRSRPLSRSRLRACPKGLKTITSFGSVQRSCGRPYASQERSGVGSRAHPAAPT